MKTLKRGLALIFALLLCLSVLVGCKKEENNQGTVDTSVGTHDGPYTDAELRAMEKDNLPEWVSTKYQGRTISTYSFKENFERDINGYGEVSGDTFYDLIYKRNMIVEQRLGIKLDNMVSSTTSFGQYAKEINVMANAQSDEFSIIYIMGNSAIQTGVEHMYFSDVTQYEYLSLDSAWWDKEAMIAQSFDGKRLNYLIGDITITTYTKAGAIFVNSDEYNNRYPEEGLDGLYDLVLAGGWTIDVLAQKAVENYNDVNDDGLQLETDDFIGFGIGSPVRVKAMEYGFDVRRWTRDENGFVTIDFDLDRASLAVDKLIALLYENPGVYYDSAALGYVYSQSFAPGNMLFYENQLGTLMGANMRDMQEDFGVLPTPKLDEDQKEYMTEIQESSTFVVIPVTCQDKEFASVVVEALCAESYRRVIYPFLESCLKIQYVRESRAGQIIDLILDSATKDYLGLYNPGGIGKLITSTVGLETNRISSNHRGLLTKANEELAKLKEEYFATESGTETQAN